MIYLLIGIAVLIAVTFFVFSNNKKHYEKLPSTKYVIDESFANTTNTQGTDLIEFNSKSNKWHIPCGHVQSDLDTVTFPPKNYSVVPPVIGMEATIWAPPIKRLALIKSVSKHELEVSVEYSAQNKIFTLRKNGFYKEKHGSSELYINFAETNFVEYKQWYYRSELEAGPLRGTDIRDYLPKNWAEFYDSGRT